MPDGSSYTKKPPHVGLYTSSADKLEVFLIAREELRGVDR